MKNLLKDQKGFTLGELIVVFLIVLAITAVMMPLIQFSHDQMERISCANNVQEVGRALFIYASEHEGQFPPTLKTLYEEEYIADPKLMDCPGSKNEGTIDEPEYVYVPGASAKDAAMLAIFGDKEGNHPGGGINVLYSNGDIVWQD